MRAESVPTCAWPAAGEKIMGSSPISGTAFCCPGLSLLPRAPYRELQRSAPFAFLSLQPLDTFCPARHVHFVFLLRRVLFISLPGSVCSPVLLLLLLSWGALDEKELAHAWKCDRLGLYLPSLFSEKPLAKFRWMAASEGLIRLYNKIEAGAVFHSTFSSFLFSRAPPLVLQIPLPLLSPSIT